MPERNKEPTRRVFVCMCAVTDAATESEKTRKNHGGGSGAMHSADVSCGVVMRDELQIVVDRTGDMGGERGGKVDMFRGANFTDPRRKSS